MKMSMTVSDDILALDERDIARVITNVIARLGLWVRKESLKRGKTLITIKNPKRLTSRFLRFKKDKGTSVKLWLGASPIGVDAWGDATQTDTGVTAGGEHYEGAFINYMGGTEPLVWRRKDPKNSRSKLERVTKSIDEPVETVAEQIANEIQDVFNQFLDEEINGLL